MPDRNAAPWTNRRTFSWKSRIPICNPEIQGDCHSCFAISAVQCLSDRYAIKYGLQKSLDLSPMYALACYENHKKLDCDSGGYALEVCQVLESLGTVSRKCWPDEAIRKLGYCPESKFGSVGAVGCCASGCTVNGKNEYAKYYARKRSTQKIYATQPGSPTTPDIKQTVEMLCREIWIRGPVVACMRIPRKLATFLTQASSHTENMFYDPPRRGDTVENWKDASEIVGAHSVCITGWVIDSKQRRYWEIRSSSKTRCGYYYMLSSEHYGNDSDLIGLDVPIQIQVPSRAQSRLRTAPQSNVLWGGATRIDAGELKSSSRTNAFSTTATLSIASIFTMAFLTGIRHCFRN